MKPTNIIFRHVRPQWFDRETVRLVPKKNGGISFAAVCADEDHGYDFWIYQCPLDVPFSSRQAVKSLRDIVANDVAPFGFIRLEDEPIVQALIRFIVQERGVFPTETGKLMLDIVINELGQAAKMHSYVKSIQGAADVYREEPSV